MKQTLTNERNSRVPIAVFAVAALFFAGHSKALALDPIPAVTFTSGSIQPGTGEFAHVDVFNPSRNPVTATVNVIGVSGTLLKTPITLSIGAGKVATTDIVTPFVTLTNPITGGSGVAQTEYHVEVNVPVSGPLTLQDACSVRPYLAIENPVPDGTLPTIDRVSGVGGKVFIGAPACLPSLTSLIPASATNVGSNWLLLPVQLGTNQYVRLEVLNPSPDPVDVTVNVVGNNGAPATPPFTLLISSGTEGTANITAPLVAVTNPLITGGTAVVQTEFHLTVDVTTSGPTTRSDACAVFPSLTVQTTVPGNASAPPTVQVSEPSHADSLLGIFGFCGFH